MDRWHVIALLSALIVLLSACGSSVSPSASGSSTETAAETAVHDIIENTADIQANLKKGLRYYAGDVFLSVAPVTREQLLESESDVYCFGVAVDGAQYLVRFCSEKVYLDEARTLTMDNYFAEIYLLFDPQDGLAGGSLQEFLNGSPATVKQINAHTVNGYDFGILGNRDYVYQMNPQQATENISSISEDGVYYFCTRSEAPVFLPYAKCAAYCKDTGGIDCGIVSLMAAMLADRNNPIQHY
jgi:hypothetical protein